MKQIPIKNRLCVLPTLLLYVCLQGTEATKTNTEVATDLSLVNQQALDTDLVRTHNQRPRPKPRPNNAGSQNNAGQYNTHYATQQNSTGFLDTSFGESGYFINPAGQSSGFNAAARALALQKNNKIVVAGIRDDYPVLVRYDSYGQLDSSFATAPYGPGVIIQTSLDKGSSFNAVAIQPDQKIVAVGDVGRTNRSPGKCLLARYQQRITNPISVVLDQNFGDKGIIRTGITGELTAVAIQKDGKIVAAGYNNYTASNTQFVLMRFNIDGTPDTDFGSEGIVLNRLGGTTSSRINGITIQEENNKIIVVGTANTFLAMARYNEDGSLDSSFGIDGTGTRILFTTGNFYDVKVQNDGKIVLVATITSPNNKSQFTVIRLDENGQQFDPSFGTIGANGVVNVSPRDINDNSYARSIAIDKNGKIIVMGYTIVRVGSTNNNYFSLVRLNHNGRLDEAFGDLGRMNNQLTIGSNRNQTTLPVFGAIQDDGRKLILAGNYYVYKPDSSPRESASGHRFAVARYWNINN